jgi:hypothetical protein
LQGKLGFLLQPKVFQMGINYNLQAAKFLNQDSPDPLFWKFRFEPYLLYNFSGFQFGVNSLLEPYNDQLLYQTSPFVGLRGGAGLSFGYDNWFDTSMRYLGDSFSDHNYLLFNADINHDFNLMTQPKDKITPPFLSTVGFKVGWSPELIFASHPMPVTSANLSNFTVGLRAGFFNTVFLSTEWQQSFAWAADNGQNTKLSVDLSGNDRTFPWVLGAKLQLQPGITEYDFKAGLMHIPLSFGLLSANMNIGQKNIDGVNSKPEFGLDVGLLIQ